MPRRQASTRRAKLSMFTLSSPARVDSLSM
jgi:hypothetical protein